MVITVVIQFLFSEISSDSGPDEEVCRKYGIRTKAENDLYKQQLKAFMSPRKLSSQVERENKNFISNLPKIEAENLNKKSIEECKRLADILHSKENPQQPYKTQSPITITNSSSRSSLRKGYILIIFTH